MKFSKEIADEVRAGWHKHWNDEDVKARMDDLADMIYGAYVAGYLAGKAVAPSIADLHEKRRETREKYACTGDRSE